LSDTLEAKIELEAVMERIKGAARRPLSSKRSFSSDKASPLYQKLNGKLVDLMLERDSLLIQYTSSHPTVVELSKQVSEIARKMIIELESQLNTLIQREQGLRKEIESVSAQVEALPVKGLELGRLERDVERTSQLYSLLETKHQEALIQNAEKPEEVIIVRPAFEPTSPINRPDMTSSGFLGALIGLVLGLVFAFIIETLDTSLGAIGDVEQTLGLPVVGLIPYVESKDGQAPLIPYQGSHSVLAESFRSLRTTLQFSALEKDIKSIVITSASPLEGKSVVAANLGIAMAQGGLKTVLLSTDLRKPMLYKLFGLNASPGLSDFLLGSSDASQAIRTVTDLLMGQMGVEDIMLTPGIDNLHIITCGKMLSNPGELIESEKFKELLDALDNHYDVVLMDTPPLIFAADASILAMKCDGVLLVYRAGEVGRGILKRIKGQLDQVKATIIGVVLNGVKAEISPDFEVVSQYKYYHYYGYGGETKKTKAKEKRHSHKKPRRLLLLLMALFLPIGALLWQAGVLDLKSHSFQGEPTVEQSSVFLSTVKILKPEKTHSAMSGDAREPVSTPSAPSHESFRIQRIEANTKVGSPENDATPVPRRAIKEFFLAKVSDPRPAPVHYPYSLMTGSFKTVEGANKQISHLNDNGLEAFWTKVDLGEHGIWFRVCVGHFETQRRQRSLKKALASRKAK
jgi:capsular exopolysaccharide synthesis family protein